MANSPSATFLRLWHYIAEQMRMSPIDQPLMLLELLGRLSPAHAVGKVITGNGITAYGNSATSLIGGDALLNLCRQRLDAIHRRSTRRRSSVRGSRHQLDLHIAAEHIGIAAESGQCGQVLAGYLEPTDGAERGAHPHGDLLLGETGPLACLQELPEQTEFHSGLLPRFAVARHLIEPGAFGTAIADDRLIRDVRHGV